MGPAPETSDVVPLPHEYAEGTQRWQRELDAIYAQHETSKQRLQSDFCAQRDVIRVEVNAKRDEQLERLNQEIHKYMISIQRNIDEVLEDLQKERILSLQRLFEDRLGLMEDAHKRDLTAHLDRYKLIRGGPSLVSSPQSRACAYADQKFASHPTSLRLQPIESPLNLHGAARLG